MLTLRPLVFFACLEMISYTAAAALDSRLSVAVSVVSAANNMAFRTFIQKPGPAFIETYVMIPADLPDDVAIVVDHEWFDGLRNPFHLAGGDWMALITLKRNGVLSIAAGTLYTQMGIPSTERNWQTKSLYAPLKPSVWYRLRIDADFAARRFISFEIEGSNLRQKIDLSGYLLDFPNSMPFSDRAMGYFVGAMRAKAFMNAPGGTPVVLFDDVRGGMAGQFNGMPFIVPLLNDSFEIQTRIGEQPAPVGPIIPVENYRAQTWYQERNESLVGIWPVTYARSGRSVLFANASLE